MNNIIRQKKGHVHYLILNRPGALNTISLEIINEMIRLVQEAENDRDCRVLVLAARGKVFCAGGNVKEFSEKISPGEALDFSGGLKELILELATFPKPLLAAVHAPVIGGGLGLVLAADIIIASSRACFSFVQRNMGLIPGAGCSYLLPRRVGLSKAKEIYFTGASLDPKAALDCGLVNMVFDAADFDNEVDKLAARIASGPPLAMSLGKGLMDNSTNRDIGTALEAESLALSLGMLGDEHREGVRAFLEKRKPLFNGGGNKI